MVRNRVRPIAHGSRRLCLAGWSTVVPLKNRTTVGRAGRRAESLTALCMLAAGRTLPTCTNQKTKKPVDVEVAGFSARLRWLFGRVYPGRAAHQIGTHCAHGYDTAELLVLQGGFFGAARRVCDWRRKRFKSTTMNEHDQPSPPASPSSIWLPSSISTRAWSSARPSAVNDHISRYGRSTWRSSGDARRRACGTIPIRAVPTRAMTAVRGSRDTGSSAR